MKKKAGSFKEWVTWQLRRLSYRWPARSQAFRNAAATAADFKKHGSGTVAKRVRNFYWCALCQGVFTRKQVSADHRVPVVDPKTGFVDWNTFIPRLFCEASNFQIICDDCHDKKTAKERNIRKLFRRKSR